MFAGFPSTGKIWVKDDDQRNWFINNYSSLNFNPDTVFVKGA